MSNMTNPICKHERYTKISDDIMLLGSNAILKMNVALYSNSDTLGKISYHREFEYYDKTSNTNMCSMKRNYDYYLSIENFKNTDEYNKEFIRIGMNEIMLIRQAFMSAIDWFTKEEHAGLYALKDRRLIITRKVNPIEINQLPMGKYIVLEPTIVEYNENQNTGIRIYLSSPVNYIDMQLNRFMGLTQALHDVNMFMCAQNMLNYIGRPEFGTNMYSFTDSRDITEIEGMVTAKVGRQIPSKNESFFDKLR